MSKNASRTAPKIPIHVNLANFRKYVEPYLSKGRRGPKPKIPLHKIFNYILSVLHTGIQWNQLQPYRGEICWSNVYKRHNRWSKDGSYEKLFKSSVLHLKDTNQLDLSILHSDGSNIVAKKGDLDSDTQDTGIRKAKKSWKSLKIMGLF